VQGDGFGGVLAAIDDGGDEARLAGLVSRALALMGARLNTKFLKLRHFSDPLVPRRRRAPRKDGRLVARHPAKDNRPGAGGRQREVAIIGFPVLMDCSEARAPIMITEQQVLDALDKPRAVYGLQQRLDPSSKSTDALQDLLMRMRTAGTVMFDIKTGKWRKA